MKALTTLAALVAFTFTSLAFASPVNINTANAEEIAEALTGIGAVKAQAIIDYRNSDGARSGSIRHTYRPSADGGIVVACCGRIVGCIEGEANRGPGIVGLAQGRSVYQIHRTCFITGGGDTQCHSGGVVIKNIPRRGGGSDGNSRLGGIADNPIYRFQNPEDGNWEHRRRIMDSFSHIHYHRNGPYRDDAPEASRLHDPDSRFYVRD